MSSIKKGQLVAAGEWAKHLRPYGRGLFWGRHRNAERQLIRREVVDADAPPKDRPAE